VVVEIGESRLAKIAVSASVPGVDGAEVQRSGDGPRLAVTADVDGSMMGTVPMTARPRLPTRKVAVPAR